MLCYELAAGWLEHLRVPAAGLSAGDHPSLMFCPFEPEHHRMVGQRLDLGQCMAGSSSSLRQADCITLAPWLFEPFQKAIRKVVNDLLMSVANFSQERNTNYWTSEAESSV